MKILFVSDNFIPECNAPATRTYEHVSCWVKNGHSVTVITCAPNFPEGKLYNGYENNWYSVEYLDNIRVVRVKTYITANEGFMKRTLDYLSFMVSSFVFGMFQSKPDVIIGTSPQFFTVCSAWLLSVFRRCPFVFELRDLWPASIKAVGAMKNSLAIRLLERLEIFLYQRAALIVTVTSTFKDELIRRGINRNKISVVVNGVDLKKYFPRDKDQELVNFYGLKDKFVVGYVGTHGMAHALDKVLETAELLRAYDKIIFVLIGSGAKREELINIKHKLNLENVLFLPRQEKQKMPDIWSMCDVSLIPLRNDELFRSVIPSKIFESMGMGLPIILSLPEGEATNIVNLSEAGITVPPENPAELAKAIVELYTNTDLRKKLSVAGSEAANSYKREFLAKLMLEEVESIVVSR